MSKAVLNAPYHLTVDVDLSDLPQLLNYINKVPSAKLNDIKPIEKAVFKEPVIQHTPAKPHKVNRRVFPAKQGIGGKQMLLNLFQHAKGPVSLKEIQGLFESNGLAPKGASARLFDLMHMGKVKKVGNGMYEAK